MSFDRKEFEDLAKQRAAERGVSRLPQLMSIAAVAPKMGALTHDEKWNSYISYLSGVKEKLEAASKSAQERMCNPSVVNQDEIMLQKITMLINEAQIRAIELAIDLPKALLENATKAEALIEKFENAKKPAEQS